MSKSMMKGSFQTPPAYLAHVTKVKLFSKDCSSFDERTLPILQDSRIPVYCGDWQAEGGELEHDDSDFKVWAELVDDYFGDAYPVRDALENDVLRPSSRSGSCWRQSTYAFRGRTTERTWSGNMQLIERN